MRFQKLIDNCVREETAGRCVKKWDAFVFLKSVRAAACVLRRVVMLCAASKERQLARVMMTPRVVLGDTEGSSLGGRKILSYSSMVFGFSMYPLNACSHCAPTAPSTTR